MHELGVVFHVIRQLREVAQENALIKISSVTLSLGEVSTVIPYYLKDCWEWAISKESGLLEGAELRLEIIPAITHCDGCGEDYSTTGHGKICPHCGSADTWLLQGNEFIIKEIEASDGS